MGEKAKIMTITSMSHLKAKGRQAKARAKAKKARARAKASLIMMIPMTSLGARAKRAKAKARGRAKDDATFVSRLALCCPFDSFWERSPGSTYCQANQTKMDCREALPLFLCVRPFSFSHGAVVARVSCVARAAS